MRSTANSARLYGTRSRTDSLKTLTATALIARMRPFPARGPRAFADLRDAAHEEILERVAQRIERDEDRTSGGELGEQPLGCQVERQFERVAVRGDFRAPGQLRRDLREHFRVEVVDDQLPAAHLEGEDVREPARRRETTA